RSVCRSTLHGATRPHPAHPEGTRLGSRAAAPEQGWPVVDGARRPQGALSQAAELVTELPTRDTSLD
ncbi:MAG TPA: hypothetical protein VN203_14230, partial [Candidatus Acidoferrum sp.]|nr:hypothetical protein [Candidatus Acidoferrum sp.]